MSIINYLKERLINEMKGNIEDSEELNKFLSKYNISYEDLSWIGSGEFGSAYLMGDTDKVLKVTTSKSEFEIAQEIMKGKYSSFATIYETAIINNSYLIIMEKLEMDSDIENLYYTVTSMLETQGLPIQYVGNFDEEEYEEQTGETVDEDVKKFINELYGIVYDYRNLGIEASDIRPENMGRDKQGNLKAFDIEDRNRLRR